MRGQVYPYYLHRLGQSRTRIHPQPADLCMNRLILSHGDDISSIIQRMRRPRSSVVKAEVGVQSVAFTVIESKQRSDKDRCCLINCDIGYFK